MKVTVHLHTVLVKKTPEGLLRKMDVDAPEGCTIEQLAQQLQILLPLEALMLAVNGRVASEGQRLEEGDQVNIMPAISGGDATPGIEPGAQKLGGGFAMGGGGLLL